MMMGLGQFVFGLDTLAFQDLERQTQWRHASNSRVGDRPARQFLGPGDETFNLRGVLAPEFKGSAKSLQQLKDMAGDGKAYALVNGAGAVYGAYVVESVQERGEYFTAEGVARRIEFTIALQRVDDDLAQPDGGLNTGDDGWDWWNVW